MSVPIGISFGDLVALARILKAIGDAWKASGGASDEFQHTVRQLESYAAIFQTIFDDKSLTGEYANAIRGQAQGVGAEVQKLLGDLRPYEAQLGARATQRALRAKTKYALQVSKKVLESWRRIEAAIPAEQLLMSLNMNASLSRIALSSSKAVDMAGQQHLSLIHVKSSIDAMNDNLASLEQELSQSSKKQLLKLNDMENSRSQPIAHQQELNSVALILTGVGQLSLDMFHLLKALVEIILRVQSHIRSHWPQILAYFRTMQTIPLTVSSILPDDRIQLIDVLGSKHNLPFQDVRNWGMFRNILVQRFRDRPGSNKVTSGHFRILDARSQATVMDEDNWAETITPRMRLVMSIEIRKLRRQVREGHCLRHACLGILRSSGGSELSCSACGLRCYKEVSPRAHNVESPVYGPKEFREDVARTRRYLEQLGERKRRRNYPEPERQAPDPDFSDVHIRQLLSESEQKSSVRDTERKDKGWVLHGAALDELRRSISEARELEEREAAKAEDLELRLFLRVHILPTIFKGNAEGSQTTGNHVTTFESWAGSFSAPLPLVSKARSLVDLVLEEETAWATTCMTNAVQNGAAIDAVDPLYGTALQASAALGSLEKTSFLLYHGADPLKPSPAWRNAIHAAAMHNHGDVLGLLLKSCHETLRTLGKENLDKQLLFREACDVALQAATMRACNSAILTLLNFTDSVHVGTAVFSGNKFTMQIVMGEALRAKRIDYETCVRMFKRWDPADDLWPRTKMEVDACMGWQFRFHPTVELAR